MAKITQENDKYQYVRLERDPSDYDSPEEEGAIISAIYANGAVALLARVPDSLGGGMLVLPLTDKQFEDLVEMREQILERVWGNGTVLAA